MAKPILVANWKNHPSSLFEARALLKSLLAKRQLFKKLSLFIAPPLPYFESVFDRQSFASLASQDMELPDILKSFGVKVAIIGHSDRRARGDTDEIVNQKVKTALRAGIIPLLCIGEMVPDHDGEHFEFLRGQLRSALAGVKNSKIMVAYEPVWAIGKSAKNALGPEELKQTVIFIKNVLSDILGRRISNQISILYGGAVESTNAKILFHDSGIRGFLIGHASLNAKHFKVIAELILE